MKLLNGENSLAYKIGAFITSCSIFNRLYGFEGRDARWCGGVANRRCIRFYHPLTKEKKLFILAVPSTITNVQLGYLGTSVWWSQIDAYLSELFGVRLQRSPKAHKFYELKNYLNVTPLDSLDGPLSSCKLVIAQVYNPDSGEQGNQHWVLVTKKLGEDLYSIIDPNYENKVTLSAYQNKFFGYVVVRARGM